MSRVYIAGPMTGLPDYNRPAFDAALARLAAAGHEPVTPVGPLHDGWGWADYMRRALARLRTCDSVALLDGWESSRGARIEASLAADLGMPAHPLDHWTETP